MNKTTTTIIFLFLLGGGLATFFLLKNKPVEQPIEPAMVINTYPKQSSIGSSVEGRSIEAFTYGDGKKHLVFVGGIHGGYEWNSTLLAYEMIDYLNNDPEIVPNNLTVTIIPSANPDGLYKITNKDGRFKPLDIVIEDQSPGRFNAHKVDLNRNFDCKWQPESTWRNQTVSAGTSAFSEPEAQAIKNFVLDNNPVAVVFWHSQSNAVYASECENGILPETLNIMNIYSEAANYKAVASFDSYPITGDAEGWLASINIPAITVELETHENTDWGKNLAGVKALFDYYEQKL